MLIRLEQAELFTKRLAVDLALMRRSFVGFHTKRSIVRRIKIKYDVALLRSLTELVDIGLVTRNSILGVNFYSIDSSLKRILKSIFPSASIEIRFSMAQKGIQPILGLLLSVSFYRDFLRKLVNPYDNQRREVIYSSRKDFSLHEVISIEKIYFYKNRFIAPFIGLFRFCLFWTVLFTAGMIYVWGGTELGVEQMRLVDNLLGIYLLDLMGLSMILIIVCQNELGWNNVFRKALSI